MEWPGFRVMKGYAPCKYEQSVQHIELLVNNLTLKPENSIFVVSQFSGIEMQDAYRSYTIMTGLQGAVVLAMTMLAYLLVA